MKKWQKFKIKYQKSDTSKTPKIPQTTEQNPYEVKARSKNTKKLKLKSGIEDHANCVSFSENEALELEKREQHPDNE